MKFTFIHERVQEFPVQLMCDALNVSRSGYYAWRDRPPCARRQRRAALMDQIEDVHTSKAAARTEARVSPRS